MESYYGATNQYRSSLTTSMQQFVAQTLFIQLLHHVNDHMLLVYMLLGCQRVHTDDFVMQALLAGGEGLRGSNSDADDDGEGDEGDEDLDLADGADLEDLYDEAIAQAVAEGELVTLSLCIFD
jgi:hypothetical protein